MKKKLILILLLSMLFACTTAPLKKEQIEKIDKITVASTLNNILPVVYFGKSHLAEVTKFQAINDWDLNARVHKKVTSKLKSLGKRVIPTKNKINLVGKPMMAPEQSKILTNLIKKSARKNSSNYLLLVSPHHRGGSLEGLGIYCQDGLFLNTKKWLAHSLTKVELIDLKTDKVILTREMTSTDFQKDTPVKCDSKSNKPSAKTIAKEFKGTFESLVDGVAKQSLVLLGFVPTKSKN